MSLKITTTDHHTLQPAACPISSSYTAAHSLREAARGACSTPGPAGLLHVACLPKLLQKADSVPAYGLRIPAAGAPLTSAVLRW